VRLHLHEWGDPSAPTIVCVHGITAQGTRFQRLARERLTPHWHVVAPDLRGHGVSGYEPPWSLEQHLDDLLESVPADARLWVGHSFGGRLVLELAARHPERIERGVLLDPALWVPPAYALERAEDARIDHSFGSVEEAVDGRYAERSVFVAPRELVEEDYRTHLAEGDDGRLRLRFSRSAVIAAFGEMSRTPPQAPLTVPLLAARALASDVCPPVLLDAYCEVAGPLLETAELPGGHIVVWDALAETAAAIESFFAGPAARTPTQ
jgi:lipase